MSTIKDTANSISIYVFCILLTIGSYYLGSRNSNQAHKLNLDRIEFNFLKEIEELQKEAREKENEYSNSVKILEEQITQVRTSYENTISHLNEYYAGELRRSEDRAKTYSNMSQAGAADRVRLANHAAELDQALTRGRDLVKRLRETIKLRESEIEYLGDKLKATHNIMN